MANLDERIANLEEAREALEDLADLMLGEEWSNNDFVDTLWAEASRLEDLIDEAEVAADDDEENL